MREVASLRSTSRDTELVVTTQCSLDRLVARIQNKRLQFSADLRTGSRQLDPTVPAAREWADAPLDCEERVAQVRGHAQSLAAFADLVAAIALGPASQVLAISFALSNGDGLTISV